MNIYLITVTYPPEIGGAAHLIYELAQSLKKRDHDVTVLTSFPQYNLKKIPPQYRRRLWMKETVDGIQVRRIRIPSMSRTSKIARGAEHFIFGLALNNLFMFAPRADVALVLSPPLPLPWLVGLTGKLRRIPVVVNIQDLFPREAVELGMLTNPFLIRMFEGMERKVYQFASAVTVHSPGNKAHVVEHSGKPERVHVVYNWVNTERIQPGERCNEFARQQGLTDRFVVSYAGTMGWAQDMGTIILGADRLRKQSGILFLLVGDGVEKEKAQARSAEMGLTNVQWLPMQPLSVYPDILAGSDVSLINLNPALRTPVVPSKLLSIMAAGRPVVASVPVESDARLIITEAQCGISVDAGDSLGLAEAIQRLYDDRELASEMGRRGRAYVETHFSREVCIDKLEVILNNVVKEAL